MTAATEASPREVLYQRPYLYPKQKAALFHEERWGVVEASTKAGKTVGCLVWLTEQAALNGGHGRNFWWVAPIIAQAKIAYRRLKRYLPDGSFTFNETERTITLGNGSVIWFKSAEHPDSLYGEDVYAVVVDEASRCKSAAWTALRSTLTATGGPARIIGNVKGSKNWAYRLARKAEAGARNWSYARLTVWDAVDAGIFPREEAEDAREHMTEAEFDELYGAVAADTGDSFFQAEKLHVVEDYPRSARVARAWDLAISPERAGENRDFTVGAKLAWDGKTAYVVDVVKKRLAPDGVVDLVQTTARKDGRACDQVFEEEKGASGAIAVEQFRRLLRNVDGSGRVFPAKLSGSKESRAFHLAARVNDGDDGRCRLVAAPWNQEFTDQADEFPDGDHDDMVDAAAHAYNHLVPRGVSKGSVRVPGSG